MARGRYRYPSQDPPSSRRRPTLSDIKLDVSSLPPPPAHDSVPPDATEAERLWQAISVLDTTTRAHASSYQADRLAKKLRAWATLIIALGGAIAAVINALH